MTIIGSPPPKRSDLIYNTRDQRDVVEKSSYPQLLEFFPDREPDVY
jgi:hypothetical protein